jgi:hypothetical protein
VFPRLDKLRALTSEQGTSFGFDALPTDPEEVATSSDFRIDHHSYYSYYSLS